MIRVVLDDLATLEADAIVRPATARLDPTTSATKSLERAGGAEFNARLAVRKELAVGSAVVTGAGGGLPAEFVIHAVIRSDTDPVTPGGVERAWLSALQRAQEWGFARLTAPPLGTGAGNLTVEDAAEIMLRVLRTHLARTSLPSDVAFVVENPEDRDVFEAVLRRGAVDAA